MKLVVGGVSLIMVAISEIMIAIVGGSFQGQPRELLATIAANPLGTRVGLYLAILLGVLLVPGVAPTFEIALTKGGSLIYAGGCLLLVGAIGHAILGAGALPLLALASPERDREQMAALVHPVGGEPLAIGIGLLLLGFVGGLLWVGGLVRARWIGIWVLVAYVVWFLIESPAGRPITSTCVGRIVGEIPFAIVFSWIGITMLRRSSLLRIGAVVY